MPRVQLIQTPALRQAIQRLQNDVNERTRDARRLTGSTACDRLRQPRTSKVNVDTGLMRRSFEFKVARGNNRIDILNDRTSPRGFPVAAHIERRYGGAARTLRQQRSSIVREVNRRLTRRVPSRLRFERP